MLISLLTIPEVLPMFLSLRTNT